ncbi:signal peptide peptidase-domain-containing protein [Trichophaea hybrida]|nr:signal peptide peptidase-domain-containing protein [Trichophaea hybrida]
MSSEAPPQTGLLTTVVPYLPTYIHLLLAALLPIYTGAHASLRRPLNTLSPKQVKALRPSPGNLSEQEEDEDEEYETSAAPESLTATDAMMFPVTAGALLGGLYLIIKYLDDPTLLSRVLTWYFCAMGVFAVGKAFADILGVAVGYVFPHQFRDAQGKLLTAGFDSWTVEGSDDEITNPLPTIKLPKSLSPFVWSLRRKLCARWVLNYNFHGEATKKPFWIGDFIGPVIGAIVVGIYAAGGKHWIFTNMMGISFSYGAMQLLSPTTFPIATLLLGLLFFYDVFFVFYTPLMVTVATNLDVPIKLLFPRPGKTADGNAALAMLGLGDVVLPGILIAMALRWDLWRFYEIKRCVLLTAAKSGKGELSKEEEKSFKPRYTKATGLWGMLFWDSQAGGAFPKTYFNASMVGYIVGMITTLTVMHVFNHAQPALLYLVPGVLGSVWGTAFFMGEAKVMWNYSEEGEVDEEDKEKEEKKDGEGTAKVKGEVDQTILSLKIIRRPALGSKRQVVANPEPQEPESESEMEDAEEEEEEEEDEDGSITSGEVVENPESSAMWKTTMLD